MGTPRLSEKLAKQAVRTVEKYIAQGFLLGGCPSAVYAAAEELHLSGGSLNSRLIAAKNYYGLVPRADVTPTRITKPIKIVAWDIETLPILAAVWHTGKQRIHSDQIIQSTSVACASWQDISTEKITSASLLDDPKRFEKDPYDDKHVVTRIHEMLMDVGNNGHILLAQNGDAFDLPKVKARIVFHGLDPLPPIQTIDTLKGSRSSGRFDSHRLDYIDKQILGGEGKVDTRGMDMWTEACAPKSPHSMRVKAMKEMVHYNRGDLPPLIRKYRAFMAYMTRHPNRAIGQGECCPRCAGKARQHIGYHDKQTRRYPTYRCESCKGVYVGTHSIARAMFKAA